MTFSWSSVNVAAASRPVRIARNRLALARGEASSRGANPWGAPLHVAHLDGTASVEVVDDDVRQCKLVRPCVAVAIHPGRTQARGARPVDVVFGVITDMQRLVCASPARVDRGIEDHARRFGGAGRSGRHEIVEQVVDADAIKPGVAVRDGHEGIASRQRLQRRQHLGKKFERVALTVENLERFVDEYRVVACRIAHSRKYRPANERQVVRALFEFFDNLRTQCHDVLARIHFDDTRIVLRHPSAQDAFRTSNDGVNLPERIVEIERNCADAIHEFSLPGRLR